MDHGKLVNMKEEIFHDELSNKCDNSVKHEEEKYPVTALVRPKEEELQESRKLTNITNILKAEKFNGNEEYDTKENIQAQIKMDDFIKCENKIKKHDLFSVEEEILIDMVGHEGRLTDQPNTITRLKKKSGEFEETNLLEGLQIMNSMPVSRMTHQDANMCESTQMDCYKSNKTKNSVVCAICARHFSCKYHLNMHIKRIHSEEITECYICKMLFSKESLRKHMQVHTDQAKYECYICKRTFIKKEGLRSHMNVHDDELCRCSICDKTFFKRTIKYHEMLHSGQTNYSCSICKKGYVTKSSLNQHMAAHTNKRLYECSLCYKTYILKTHLKQHIMIHNNEKNFVCHLCGKRFPVLFYLNGHMKESHYQEDYKCSVCESSFKRKYHLKRHIMNVHFTSRKYQCSVCRKRFAQKYNVNTHIRRVHNTPKVRKRKSVF